VWVLGLKDSCIFLTIFNKFGIFLTTLYLFFFIRGKFILFVPCSAWVLFTRYNYNKGQTKQGTNKTRYIKMKYTEKTAYEHYQTLPENKRKIISDKVNIRVGEKGLVLNGRNLRIELMNLLNEPYLKEQELKALQAKKESIQPQQKPQLQPEPKEQKTKSKKVFNKSVPAILTRNNIELRQFKFRLDDSNDVTYKKVKYIKGLIKGKDYSIKKTILEFYEIHLDFERRSNQYYLYGWKNLNDKKYKFYVGKSPVQKV